MKSFLLFPDRDFDVTVDDRLVFKELIQDLELKTLFEAMANNDVFIYGVAERIILRSLDQPHKITYRQQLLDDALKNPDVIVSMYQIAIDTLEKEKKVWGWGKHPEGLLHRNVEVLRIFMESLIKLRSIAENNESSFQSEGFHRFFKMLVHELNNQYIDEIKQHLHRLQFRQSILMSAQLGKGNKGFNYIIRQPLQRQTRWIDKLQSWTGRLICGAASSNVYEIPDRDESGYRALGELRNRGIGYIATAATQSGDSIRDFLEMLRFELAFYVGCLNLRNRLALQGSVMCFPVPLGVEGVRFEANNLYDVCLSLTLRKQIVGNDVVADHQSLVMITGANRGGKSTFLRSVGVSFLMMQAGMFVGANFFKGNLCKSFFSHFKREEDESLRSGKLDEELLRLDSIVNKLVPGSLVLFNESFASTNEREGSEIARQIVSALLESGIRVFYVTHMFDLAHAFDLPDINVLFLRAERKADGQRTFRLLNDKPLKTSFGEDLYWKIFGEASSPNISV